MPHVLIHAPGHDRNRSLGWLAVAFIEHFVRHGPGNIMGQPVRHGDEFTAFIVDCYALDGDGRMIYNSVFFSRPKGSAKSALAAQLALFEAFGPARFGGWAEGGETWTDPWGLGFTYTYQPGEPMGVPVTAPSLRIMATEVGQVGNVFKTIYYNLDDSDCPLSHIPGVDVGKERILLPQGGEIIVSTASAMAKDGGLETWVCFDETHGYNTNELRDMYDTVVRNLRKRAKYFDCWYIETTTMFQAGEESIAEATYNEAEAIRTGRKKLGRSRLLYSHRYGECKDLRNAEELKAALIDAFGEAMTWNDLETLVDGFYDTRSKPEKSRRYFLNAQTSSSDAWVAAHEWDACKRPDRALQDGDLVCLGFDGSVRDDSTCLVAVRVSDGHAELLGAWEKPDGPEGEDWQVDREAVDAAVAEAMRRFEVAGMYADPAHWQDYLDRWNNEFGELMRVKATERRPLEWWTNRPRPMVAALERLHEAILDESMTFTPAEDRVGRQAELALILRTHVTNARRRVGRSGLTIAKEHPNSKKKIDGAMALCLGWECRMDAVALGIKPEAEQNYVPRRLR